jgi:hypothetical protein
MLCEKRMTIVEARSALLVPQSIKHVMPIKTQNNTWKINKHCTNCGMANHNVETCRKKEKRPRWQPQRQHNQVKRHIRHLHLHVTFVV